MPYTVVPPHIHWRSTMSLRLPGAEPIEPMEVTRFPWRECPPIRYARHAAHHQHAILLGRRQMRALPEYSVISRGSFSHGPIMCQPSSGTILVTPSVVQLLELYEKLLDACCMPTVENWARLAHIIPSLSPAPVPTPAVWTITVAVGDARLGSIIECIEYEHRTRYYAELTQLIAADFQEVLFMARILGHAKSPTCLVRSTIDFVDPDVLFFLSSVHSSVTHTLEANMGSILAQPGFALLPGYHLSVAILPEQVVGSETPGTPPSFILLLKTQYVQDLLTLDT